jgi:hypothetical protein
MISIKKEYLYWAGLFFLQVLFVAYLQGYFTPASTSPVNLRSSKLNLTKEQAKLVRSAIARVQSDLGKGTLPDIQTALDAFRSLLPGHVKDKVMKELGSPDLGGLRDALEVLDGKAQEYE